MNALLKKNLKYNSYLHQELYQYETSNLNPRIHVQHIFSRKMFELVSLLRATLLPSLNDRILKCIKLFFLSYDLY